MHPHLIDLLAALATGVVGSVALVRRDISDTLPGVAIAISLVPPLSVVGLTLEAGAYGQSLGAFLLFLTNVAAILATGIIVMALYGVQRLATGPATALSRRRATFVVVALVVIVAVPLTISSINIAGDTRRELKARDAGEEWAGDVGWELTNVTTQRRPCGGRVRGTVAGARRRGSPPGPDRARRRSQGGASQVPAEGDGRLQRL